MKNVWGSGCEVSTALNTSSCSEVSNSPGNVLLSPDRENQPPAFSYHALLYQSSVLILQFHNLLSTPVNNAMQS